MILHIVLKNVIVTIICDKFTKHKSAPLNCTSMLNEGPSPRGFSGKIGGAAYTTLRPYRRANTVNDWKTCNYSFQVAWSILVCNAIVVVLSLFSVNTGNQIYAYKCLCEEPQYKLIHTPCISIVSMQIAYVSCYYVKQTWIFLPSNT